MNKDKKINKDLMEICKTSQDGRLLKWIKELSLCPHCFCITKTIKGKCGKCKKRK